MTAAEREKAGVGGRETRGNIEKCLPRQGYLVDLPIRSGKGLRKVAENASEKLQCARRSLVSTKPSDQERGTRSKDRQRTTRGRGG